MPHLLILQDLHHSARSQEVQHSVPERLSTGRSDLCGHESVQALGSQVPQGWTRTSSPTGPTDPLVMLSCLPCITFCSTSRPPAHIPGCCSWISVQHSTQSSHGSCLTNWSTWVLRGLCACGFWTSSRTGHSQWESASRPPGRSPSTSVPLRGVCSHLCCSQVTACHQSPLLSWLSFQMIPHWVWSTTLMSRPTRGRLRGWLAGALRMTWELNVSKTNEMVFDFR